MPITKIAASGFSDAVNFRNIIINGDMSVAQRSTSETGKTSSGMYTVDRFGSGISSAQNKLKALGLTDAEIEAL